MCCSFKPPSFYTAVIPGAIKSISAVEGKGWLFHVVLAVERTGEDFCVFFFFLSREALYTQKHLLGYMGKSPF